ncbi:MAG: hypothetical protein LBL74_03620 [Bacteroidales bacterium]|jgi:ribonuclease R|nr:hypothetical protein [Bacteroidales bacterium]
MKKVSKLEQSIIVVFTAYPFSPQNARQIGAKIGIKDKSSRQIIYQNLISLAKKGVLSRTEDDRFCLNAAALPSIAPEKLFSGVVNVRGRRIFVSRDDTGEEVLIRQRHTLNACHQDKVKIFVFPVRRHGEQEGEIIEVIKRARTTFTGTINKIKGEYLLFCNSPNVPFKIHIAKKNLSTATEKHKVLVEIVSWGDSFSLPQGRVINDLGPEGTNEAEMLSILTSNNFPLTFGKESLTEIRSLLEERDRNGI